MDTFRRITTALLILAAVNCTAADHKQEEAKKLFEVANAATDLRQQPYQLRAHVRLRFQSEVEGDLLVDWKPPEQQRFEIRLPGYREIHVLNNGQLWIQRPGNVTPLRIEQLLQLLKLKSSFVVLYGKVTNIDSEVRQGKDLVCVVSEIGASKEKACFDKQTHVLARLSRGDGLPFAVEYTDYQTVGTKLYPGRMSLTERGTLVAEVMVETIVASAAADEFFGPLPQVHPQPACAEPTPPRGIHAPDPDYDEGARLKGIQGTLTLAVSIGADGTVQNAEIVRPLDPGLERKAVKTIKQWRFQPARCNGLAVPSEVPVDVNFRLY